MHSAAILTPMAHAPEILYLGCLDNWMSANPYNSKVMNRLNTTIKEAADKSISSQKKGGILIYDGLNFQEYKSGTHTDSANAPRFFGFHSGEKMFCVVAVGVHIKNGKTNHYEGMTWLGHDTFPPTYARGSAQVTDIVPAAFQEYFDNNEMG